MNQRLLVGAHAEADLREGFSWYEERSPGLGHAFLDCVEARLNVIAAAPQLFRPRVGAHRLAAIQRFPYGIYFIWDETNSRVTIRRVLHFKQDRRLRLRS